jgi:signal transduction histidine kinase
MIDMTVTKRAYASLEEAYQRLQRMSRELQTVEANERRRLSRELHDEMGQLLTALKFDLEASRQALSDKPTAKVRRAFERTVRALETTDELFARLRRVVRALRPSVLEELGLKDALEALVRDIQTRSDLVCSVSVEGKVAADPSASAIEAALYRMTQELVTNVVRHAQAMTLSVHLDVDTRQWALTVQDDGIGFNPKAESIVGMGIRGVRERAEILGGRVDVSSAPGAGTTVTVWIPVRPLDVSEETPQAL